MKDLPPDPDRTSDVTGDCAGRGLIGSVIGRYRVDLFVGEGGMGEVYRAWDTLLEHWVALKRPLPGPESDEKNRQHLLREARAASALHHHAIAAIHDVIEHGDERFIVQEFVEGDRLRDRIGEPFDLSRFLRFAEDCAEALVVAAEHGIVHCDIKPENIRLTTDGRPKILDFGIARRTAPESGGESTLTETVSVDGHRHVRGTVAYLAPEVIGNCPPTARSDLFSLGIVFYEVLTGVNPFKKETRPDTIASLLADSPAPPSEVNPNVPAALDDVVARLLAKAPQERFAAAADLLDALRAVREGARAPAKPPVPFPLTRILGVPFVAFAPVAGAILLSIAILGWPPWPRPSNAAHYISIPAFKTLSDDPNVQFFASGLTEALRARLAELKGIYVVDPASPYGVDLTLEGGFQRAQNQLRISYTLMDVSTSLSIGGGLVEGDVREIFRLQDDVIYDVVRVLEDKYHLGVELAAAPRPTRDAAVYTLYLQARGYLANSQEEHNVEMAIALFEGALARDSVFPVARSGLAEAYWKRYETTRDTTWAGKAVETARGAVAAGPNVAEARVTLASILFGMGKIEGAAEEYRRAIELDPRALSGYSGLAKSEERLGRAAAAEATLKRAVAERPEDWEAERALGVFYFRQGRHEDALTHFRRVVALAPDSAHGYSNLGANCVRMGLIDEALAAFKRSLELKPNYKAYSNYATLLRTQRRFEEAAGNYEKALALDGLDYRIWAGLSDACRQIPGGNERADSACARAIVLLEKELLAQPDDPARLVALSQLYAHRGRAEEARRSVERALSLAPEQGDVLLLLNAAETFEVLGERESALGTLEKAFQRGASVGDIKESLALAELVKDPRFERLVRSVEAGKGSGAR